MCNSPSFRLYLINSPVVRAENLRFKEEGVRDVLKDVLLPWYNAYRFFIQNVFRLQKVSSAAVCLCAELWAPGGFPMPLRVLWSRCTGRHRPWAGWTCDTGRGASRPG